MPIPAKKTLVVGAAGQIGLALRNALDGPVEYATRADLDVTIDLSGARRWRDYGTIVNGAAHTAVDAAETDRAGAWAGNVTAVSQLARIATEHGITLVHVSSDYVFDGTATTAYREDEPVARVCRTGR